MFIELIEYENFCQHRRLRKEFSGNLIGIVGSNGSGKSNLMNGMQFALCGAVPGKDKSDLLTDGEDDGNVKLVFRMPDNRRVAVIRSLAKSEATLEIGHPTDPAQVTRIRGITAVNNALNELMGMDRDLLAQSVFVRQAELDSILFLEPAVRERAWLRLIGLTDAVKIHARLGPVVSSIPQNPDYEESIKLNLESLRADRTRIHQLWARFRLEVKQSPYEQLLAGCMEFQIRAERDALMALISRIGTARRLAKSRQDCDANTQYLEMERIKVQGQLDALRAVVPPDANDRLAEMAVRISELRRAAQGLRTSRDMSAQLELAKKKLLELRNVEELDRMLTELADHAAKLSSELCSAEGERKVHHTMATAVASVGTLGSTCPLCMQPVADPTGLTRRLTDAMARCDSVIREVRPALQKINMEVAGLRTTKNHEQTARVELGKFIEMARVQIASALAGLQGIPDNARPEDVENQANSLGHDVAQLKQAMSQLDACERQLTGFDGRIRLSTGEKDSIDRQLAEMGAVDTSTEADIMRQIHEIDTALKGMADLAKAGTELSSALKEAYRNAGTRIRLVKDLRRRNGMQAETRLVQTVAEHVRDWFHHSKGPHGAVLSVLEQLTPDVNRFLGDLASPFSVVPDGEQLMFRYSKSGAAAPRDGRHPAATRLSGGEKVLLAMSFRLASYCMFASKLGLLTLDEPTVYLDEQNVTRMCCWMEKLGEIARKLKVQILISTHERAIIPMMDTVLDLTPTNS